MGGNTNGNGRLFLKAWGFICKPNLFGELRICRMGDVSRSFFG